MYDVSSLRVKLTCRVLPLLYGKGKAILVQAWTGLRVLGG